MRTRFLKGFKFFGGFALVAILIAGCSSESKRRNIPEEAIAPKPPVFIIGPAAVLLTNATPFNARLTVEWTTETNKFRVRTGQLLGQGSHLLFSMERNDRTFVWDVNSRNGFVVSEALQGYAPLTSPIQVTNIATLSETAGPSSERVNGHPGHEAEVNISSDDGSVSRFSIWRASDLNGYPVRIRSLTASKPFVINIEDVRSASLNPNLFQPPDGFTKYVTPDLMATELIMRRSKPKANETPSLEETLQQKPRSSYSH